MLKTLLKALSVVFGLTLSGIACAVSLGGINVSSALGEPLKAEIALETASNAETNSLVARMASPEAFKNAGVDYPYGLPLLAFKIETNLVNGDPYLKITSLQPVNEPFVNLLVELNWSSGKLLREYTFLLDPPGYVVEQPGMAEVQPVQPSVIVPPPATEPQAGDMKTEAEIVSPSGVQASEPETATPPQENKETAEPVPVVPAKPSEKSLTENSTNVVSDTITVKRGDTLRKLAAQVKSPDISLERMLVALYRANADAFDGKNMNRLKRGKVLQVPQQAELDNLDQADAVQEIRVQAADWHAYRQKLAAASKRVTDEMPKQEVSGKISAKVADQAPAAKESAKEVVRLSKGEAPNDKSAVGGSAKSAQDKAQTQQEEAIARDKTIKESNERVAMLEKNLKDMQRLAELKNQMAAEQAKSPAKSADSVGKEKSAQLGVLPKMSAPTAASDVAAASGVQAAMPKPKVGTAQPSLLDELLGQPVYLAGIAAVLLALLGFAYARSRRGQRALPNKKMSDSGKEINFGGKAVGGNGKTKKADGNVSGGMAVMFGSLLSFVRRKRGKSFTNEESEDVGSSTGRIMAPVAPSPDTGDFTKTLVSKTPLGHPPTDEVDPISEADLFLNFGRDEQAEEILRDALSKNPKNHLIHLKLLSIYANRKDTHNFSTIASQLKDSGDAAAWEQAMTMGLKLEPGNPLYGGDGGAAKGPTPSVGADTLIDVGTVKKQPPVMDFDLGTGTAKMPAASVKKAAPVKPEQQTQVLSTPMDFDITGSHTDMTAPTPENVETSEVQLDDLIFDVTDSHEAKPTNKDSKQSEQVTVSEEPEETISFLLDFPSKPDATPPQTASNAALDIGLADINLNLDEIVAPTTASSVAARSEADEVATKLDLAKAYQEMGDSNGAREILEEVVRDGNEQQRAAAEALLQTLPA